MSQLHDASPSGAIAAFVLMQSALIEWQWTSCSRRCSSTCYISTSVYALLICYIMSEEVEDVKPKVFLYEPIP